MHCLSTVAVMCFQLASVQTANATAGIKHVFTTLMTSWKFFHYFPKRAELLKEIQKGLDLPELKIVKQSDTRWIAHERCLKAVKASYSSIVLALENIYEISHEPEALGLSKALSSLSTIAAMYLLDYILPQVAKLSRALQTKHLDLSLISSLVDATLNSLDDAMYIAFRKFIFTATRCKRRVKRATGIEVTHLDIIYLFKKEWASLLSDSSKITYPASLDPPPEMCYRPSVFLIQRKCPASLLMSYLYMETFQFKLHWTFWVRFTS